jgi:hypothetical protein
LTKFFGVEGNTMTSGPNRKTSDTCFRFSATLLVLAVAFGLPSCVAKSEGGIGFSVLLLGGAAVSLVIGIIAAIWDE